MTARAQFVTAAAPAPVEPQLLVARRQPGDEPLTDQQIRELQPRVQIVGQPKTQLGSRSVAWWARQPVAHVDPRQVSWADTPVNRAAVEYYRRHPDGRFRWFGHDGLPCVVRAVDGTLEGATASTGRSPRSSPGGPWLKVRLHDEGSAATAALRIVAPHPCPEGPTTGCDPSPSRSAVDEVADVREATSVSACHTVVLNGAAEVCRVTTGPESGAVVEPVGVDDQGRATAATTSRSPA